MLETSCFDGQADRALDLDFAYVLTWEKLCYAAFVIDVFSRRIDGWRVAASMGTEPVLGASEMALWSRGHEDLPVGERLVVHSDLGSHYKSFSFTRRLIDVGVDASIGSVGDTYDNRADGIRHRPLQNRTDQQGRTLTNPFGH